LVCRAQLYARMACATWSAMCDNAAHASSASMQRSSIGSACLLASPIMRARALSLYLNMQQQDATRAAAYPTYLRLYTAVFDLLLSLALHVNLPTIFRRISSTRTRSVNSHHAKNLIRSVKATKQSSMPHQVLRRISPLAKMNSFAEVTESKLFSLYFPFLHNDSGSETYPDEGLV